MMEPVVGHVSIDETLLGRETDKAPKAPGMKYRHYAPKAKLMIVEGNVKEEVLAIRQLCYAAVREGKRVGVIATNETYSYYTNGVVKNIGTREMKKQSQGICMRYCVNLTTKKLTRFTANLLPFRESGTRS